MGRKAATPVSERNKGQHVGMMPDGTWTVLAPKMLGLRQMIDTAVMIVHVPSGTVTKNRYGKCGTVAMAAAEDKPLSWYEYFIKIAETVSLKSKDPSTKVGAVIVGEDHQILSTGFNGAPRGVPECHERPKKYMRTEHAERNAVYNAAMHGITLKGSTMYIYGYPPCADCARAIVQSGIKEVVVYQVKALAGNWMESAAEAVFQFGRAGISMTTFEDDMSKVKYNTFGEQ